MSWAKWHAEHPYEAHPRERKEGEKPVRSADKLAESIKSSLGHDATKGGVRKGGGGVESRSVSGRSVVSRSVDSKSVVSTPGKKEFKRAAPVKGEKDRADSARTKIRMAAHYRGKKGEQVGPQGPIKPEGGNTGKIRSADRLAARLQPGTDKSGISDEYNRALENAKKLSASAGTPAEHRAAAVAFRDAAAKATDDKSRTLHTKLAENHEKMAIAEEQSSKKLDELNRKASGLHGTLGKTVTDPTAKKYHESEADKHSQSKFMAARAVAVNASAKADKENTPEAHRAASAAHTGAANLAVPGSKEQNAHDMLAVQHRRQAEKLEAAKTSAASEYETARSRARAASNAAHSGENTPEKHMEAARAHGRAADLAPNNQLQRSHDTQARNHRNEAKQLQAAKTSGPSLSDLSDIANDRSAEANTRNTKELHQAAADAHQKAADEARKQGDAGLASYHQTKAGQHQMVADARGRGPSGKVGSMGASLPQKTETLADKSKKASDEAWALSRTAKTAAQHEKAAAAHGLAGDLRSDKAGAEMHLRQALDHQAKADKMRAAAKARAADKAADKAAAKADQNEFTDAGKQYKDAREVMLAARGRMITGNTVNRGEDARTVNAMNDLMKKLWPRLTHRDVAESVVQYNKEINPDIHKSLVGEITKHVAFTGKSGFWKRATVDVGDTRSYKYKEGSEAAKDPGRVRGVTLAGEHIVMGGHLFGRDAFGHSNQNKHGFNIGWHTASTFGPDDLGGHRSTLAHEVGHVVHHALNGGAAIPDTHGHHMSQYGNTNHHEGAAEAYTAAFARAHGHQYSNDQVADVGDQMATEIKRRKA